MKLSEFDYTLPESFIAQFPLEPRDSSKLMLLDKTTGEIHHRHFYDIVDYLNAGDVLVLNETRVIPARLFGIKTETGGKVEVLLLRKLGTHTWQTIVGGRGIHTGVQLSFGDGCVHAKVIEALEASERVIEFDQMLEPILDEIGEMPLPPYIHDKTSDDERYQTVYSRVEGSAAAPTAGLHFTDELFLKLREKGVQFARCVLHIGLGTFQPVKTEDILDHPMHSEWAQLDATNSKIINEAKLRGNRVIAVGTTATRVLETAGILSEGGDPSFPYEELAACAWRPVIAFEQDTRLFIYPRYRWRVVDAMITNFHLPKSTLLMMISSFAGKDHVFHAYEVAKEEGYRFFSFGDAMFIADF